MTDRRSLSAEEKLFLRLGRAVGMGRATQALRELSRQQHDRDHGQDVLGPRGRAMLPDAGARSPGYIVK